MTERTIIITNGGIMKRVIAITLMLPLIVLAGETKSLEIGKTAPVFTLKNYDGEEYSLDKIFKHNKLTALMFISTQCPISNAYNDRMVSLHKTYRGKGIAFVGVNSNKEETPSEISAHCKDNDFEFLVLKDEGNRVADEYGAQVTPEIYLIDARGVLVYHGRIDDNRIESRVESRDLVAALEALLAGKEPPRTETKAFGCTIKRITRGS